MTAAAAKRRVDPSSNGDPDFDFVYLNIDDATAELELQWLRGGPTLVVRPAGESNPAWQAGMLRLSGNRQRNVLSSGKVTKEDADRDRDDDRRLYPKTVIVGWRGVMSRATGKEVKFSVEACERFLKQLPDWVFNKIRIFCMRPENFISAEELEPDVAGLAENS